MHPPSAKPAPTAPPRRRCAAGIGRVLLVPALLLLALRLAGLSVGTPWVQLLSLTPFFIVPSLGALLFFVLARRRGPLGWPPGPPLPWRCCWWHPLHHGPRKVPGKKPREMPRQRTADHATTPGCA